MLIVALLCAVCYCVCLRVAICWLLSLGCFVCFLGCFAYEFCCVLSCYLAVLLLFAVVVGVC